MTPDPSINAYRDDVADIALAGQVIASHYAEPVMRRCRSATVMTAEARHDAASVAALDAGAAFALLDCAHGRAWGYAVTTHLVGYVDEDALGDA